MQVTAEVPAPEETAPEGTGPVNTGSVNTGSVDTGSVDTGPVDTGNVAADQPERVGALRRGLQVLFPRAAASRPATVPAPESASDAGIPATPPFASAVPEPQPEPQPHRDSELPSPHGSPVADGRTEDRPPPETPEMPDHPGPAPQAEPAAPQAKKKSFFGLLAPSKDVPQPLSLGLGAPADTSVAIVTSAAQRPAPTLVTGATGFVGSAVARALAAEGHPLRLLVRPGADRSNIEGLQAEIVEGDLTDAASLAAALVGCRYLVHVAADYRLWVPKPATMQATNVDGTRALMLAARDAGVERIVYCSSVAALGLEGDGTPGTEDTPVDRDNIVGTYKRSKYDAEMLVRAMAADGIPVVIVAPSAPVGPRDRRPTPTGKMILDAAAGRMPAYVETGLNIVHVDDVAHGHVLALQHGQIGETYILGGDDLGMAHLLAIIDDVMGRPPKNRKKLSTAMLTPFAIGSELKARVFGTEPRVTREMLAMADKQMFFSSAKAADALGYTARPARQAVADAVAWFRQAGLLRD